MHATCILDKHGKCPVCHADWDGGAIFDSFRHQAYYRSFTDAELRDLVADAYGDAAGRWSRLCGIEIEGRYDGVSLWQCPDCRKTWAAEDVQFLTAAERD
jgi:ribosomal protein L37AE/L43A